MKLTFDVETNGLLDKATDLWVLVTQDVETEQTYIFTDHLPQYPSIEDGLNQLTKAEALIGHNIIKFDIPVLKKLKGWEPPKGQKHYDTFIMCTVGDFKRKGYMFVGPRGAGSKQGLASWGEAFEFPKDNFKERKESEFGKDNAFAQFDKEMVDYCKRDVHLNTKVYKYLLQEVAIIRKRNPLYSKGLEIEHKVGKFDAIVTEEGFRFDLEGARKLLKEIEREMNDIAREIEPGFGNATKLIDKQPKQPKYTKAGWYTATTARLLSEYFGREIRASEAISDKPPIQPGEDFQRSEEVPIKLGQDDLVKQYLDKIGWEPDDWNVKKDHKGRWIKTTPKFTDTSLSKLGTVGKAIARWNMLDHRRGILATFIDYASINGRIHGSMWTVGTNTFRCRHEVVVNLPSSKAELGPEIRSLFLPDEGHVLVGADSSGNELRALAHYLDDPEYTKEVLDGDVHQRNADILGCSRDVSKTWIYGFLYGAGGAKLGKTLGGSAAAGNASKEKFNKAIPSLPQLNSKLHKFWGQYQWVPGLDGRKIYVEKNYQCLNALLQAAGAVTCKAAVAYAMDKIEEEGLEASPRLFMHDEMQWSVKEEHADRVAEILVEAFTEAPKQFGVEIMTGEAMKGSNLAETH